VGPTDDAVGVPFDEPPNAAGAETRALTSGASFGILGGMIAVIAIDSALLARESFVPVLGPTRDGVVGGVAASF
jgi:hypothetical protein